MSIITEFLSISLKPMIFMLSSARMMREAGESLLMNFAMTLTVPRTESEVPSTALRQTLVLLS